ncbi:MAG TPA: DUF72 domain-containing protein [Dehalococcoidia bacterium]|nr:DUF72 domain-containing protein [Dehalococcoidia bacterium]
MATNYIIGTSGWHYEHWRATFYPPKLAKSSWLEFYARHFHTVELNASFYRLPSEDAFKTWHRSTPPDFTFAVKVSRFITHIKRLRNAEEPLHNFLERAQILGEKLGPLLYQLPPGLHRDDEVLESFLAQLPHGWRHAFEFRHGSWLDDEVFQILRQHNVGLCVFDMPKLTCPLVATADFAYIRFHGSDALYSSNYSDEELADWAKKITQMADTLKTVYIYFNNDIEGFALNNARTIRTYLQAK